MKLCHFIFFIFYLPAITFGQSPAQIKKLTIVTRELIDTYNSADTFVYRSFFSKYNIDASRRADLVRQFGRERGHLGKIRTLRIKVVNAQQTEALVQTPKYEAWWRVVVMTDSVQRFKEHHMGIVRVTDEVLLPGRLTHARVNKEIDDFIARQASFDVFSGNVFIERKGKVIYSRSFGTNTNGQPNTFQQQFNLASLGKMFTAISILQLVGKQKLKLEDSVGRLLPELRNKRLSKITIHQLLTHTSGMGDYFEDPDFVKLMDSTGNDLQVINTRLSESSAFLPFVEKDSLHFEPGTNWSYSNTGFELLGYILEKITGISYKEYVRQHVLQTAGMSSTSPGLGSGGGYSNVADLNRFAGALQRGTLLDGTLAAKFLHFRVNESYGYGSEHQVLGGEHIIGHSGGFAHVCNELNIYEHSGYTVIILSNSNPPFGHFLSDKIKQLLVRKV